MVAESLKDTLVDVSLMVSFTDDLPGTEAVKSIVTLGGGFLISASPLGKNIVSAYN